jgi:hypothetical protein
MKTELRIELTLSELKELAGDALAARYGVAREAVALSITKPRPVPKRTAMQELSDQIEAALAPAGGVFRGSSVTVKDLLIQSADPGEASRLKRIKISTIGRAIPLLREKGFTVSQHRERQGSGRMVRVWSIHREES